MSVYHAMGNGDIERVNHTVAEKSLMVVNQRQDDGNK